MESDLEIWDPKGPAPAKTLEINRVAYTLFPEELTELRKEIQHHPDLLLILHTQSDKDVYIQLAEIAAHCGIVLDGDYTQQDILKLCKLLTNNLMAKRVIVVNPP